MGETFFYPDSGIKLSKSSAELLYQSWACLATVQEEAVKNWSEQRLRRKHLYLNRVDLEAELPSSARASLREVNRRVAQLLTKPDGLVGTVARGWTRGFRCFGIFALSELDWQIGQTLGLAENSRWQPDLERLDAAMVAICGLVLSLKQVRTEPRELRYLAIFNQILEYFDRFPELEEEDPDPALYYRENQFETLFHLGRVAEAKHLFESAIARSKFPEKLRASYESLLETYELTS
jgi:hypothetical protein